MIQLPEGYKERPMKEDGIDLVSRLADRFKNTKLVMPAGQRQVYENITKMFLEDVKKWRGFPKQIHKPNVCDVGCGLGIGANIMSQEAQFVWGIDSNKDSIEFATQMFGRMPNNIYYTPQVTFDVIDITNEHREPMRFDYVTCVEVIEHIPSSQAIKLVEFLNRLVKTDKQNRYITDETRTKIYVTTPNRNSDTLQKDTPRNEHHCYEANAAEMYSFFTKHYQYVTVLDVNMVPQELNTTASPLIYKLEIPLTNSSR